jgi:hypothetical protein
VSLPTERRLAAERRTWYTAADINQLPPLCTNRDSQCTSGADPRPGMVRVLLAGDLQPLPLATQLLHRTPPQAEL